MIKKLAWLLMCLFLLVSCGGGTDMASNGVGSGGTGSYTSGPVSGLGSIIVNGVRYDVENATVTDDDGTVGFGKSSLNLGMLVEVQGTDITAGVGGATDVATATVVKASSDFVGRVSTVNTSGSVITSIVLFGRQIDIDSKTVYSYPIHVNDCVVVHGLVASGGYKATRIDQSTACAQRMKLSGVVHGLTDSGGAPRFKVGLPGTAAEQTIFYGSATVNNAAALANGAIVRVVVNPVPFAGAWVADRVRVVGAAVDASRVARLEGLIARLDDQQHFVVNGVVVDASGVSIGSTLSEGNRVELRGRIVNGRLVLTQSPVVESGADIDDREVELHGRITTVNAGATTIVVRGLVVNFSAAILRDGAPQFDQCVEVRGKLFNLSNQLIATEVKTDNDCR
jgi:hypothetical protein